MENYYGMLKRLLLMVAAIAVTNLSYAQQRTITGQVTDTGDGNPIPGVNVIVKGTTSGTITDFDGKFTIQAADTDVLVFSYIGYVTTEQTVGSASSLNIMLQASDVGLGEVVIIGYGTVKKEDATGSISTVSSDDFNKGAITSPQELLTGKSSGVVITSDGGAPGSGSQIRIRGGSSLTATNDPLIVIDGVPISNNDLDGSSNILSVINPNDIESFTVLKDASSTAIYGSRASNGVILITTKKGKEGKPLKISYNGWVSLSQPIDYVDVYTGDQFRQMVADNIDLYGASAQALLGNENTDWQKEIFRTSISSDHNITATGSVKNVPYRVSIGYNDHQGILKNTDSKKTTASVALNPSFLEDHLKVNVNFKGMHIKNNFGDNTAVGDAVSMDPTQPIMNGNTSYAGYFTWTSDYSPNGTTNGFNTNPVAKVNLTDNKSTVYRIIGNIQADYKFHFLPELRANLNVAYDYTESDGHNNVDTTAGWMRRARWGQLTDYDAKSHNELIEFYLNYTKDISSISSKVDVTGGYSWQHFKREGFNYDRSIVDDAHPLVPAIDSSSYATEYYLVSFFGRVNYTLMDRYLLTGTLRADGSSRFAKDNRWGVFPSAALAWNVKKESFLESVRVVTDLKLRVGWGITGQQDIFDPDNSAANYPAQALYTIAQPGFYYQFGNEFVPTLRPGAYDPDIKWESTTTTNIGLDFGFLDDRITGSVDLYKRVTDDLLNNVPIPNGSNFSNFLTTNVGSLENRGIEVSLNVRPIAREDMGLEIGFNLTYNENEITKLTLNEDPNYQGVVTGDAIATSTNVQIHTVGYPASSFFVNQQVYDANGNPIEGVYVDLSGDGGALYGIAKNMYRYKKAAPDYLMGLSVRFNYKDFDISASSRISIGNYVYNANAAQASYDVRFSNGNWANAPLYLEEHKFFSRQYYTDYFVENASFFKLDNISAGYNFNNIYKDKLSARVSLSAQNLFTITKYEGLDPEVANGIDNNFYPRPRVFILGLNLTF